MWGVLRLLCVLVAVWCCEELFCLFVLVNVGFVEQSAF